MDDRRLVGTVGVCLRFAVWQSATFVLALAQAVITEARPEYIFRLLIALASSLVWGACWPGILLSLPARIRKAVMVAAIAFLTLFAGLSAYHLVVYEQLMGTSSIYAIADTNASEVLEYFSLTSRPAAWVAAISMALAMTLLGISCQRSLSLHREGRRWAFRSVTSLLTLGALTVLLSGRAAFAMNNPFLFAFQSATQVAQSRSQMKYFSADSPAQVKSSVQGREGPEVHILVIGESLTPSHMSAYGYSRATTPELDKPRSFARVLVANACSSKPNTQLALIDVMTAAGRYGEAPLWQRPNLIAMLSRNSYKTYWLSNQPAQATLDTMSSAWSKFADVREFVNLRGWQEGYAYDERLLPRVEAALTNHDKRKVIIVHMLGSHPEYSQRYPKGFEQWQPQASVPESVPRGKEASFPRAAFNHYDNSVLYTDHFMGRLLDLAQQHGVATVTFFSDHGQNLAERNGHLGHSLEKGPRQGYEVPVIFWLSTTSAIDASRRTNLRKNAALPYQTNQLLPTLIDLYGISTEDEAFANSLLSERYRPVERACDGMT